MGMFKHLCCKVSEKCRHNSSPEEIQEIMAVEKAKQAEQEKEWVKHLEPFDMQEWYRRIKE